MIQARRVCAVMTLGLLGAFATPAWAGAGTSLRADGADAASFGSDGTRFAAWQEPGRSDVLVLDLRTSRKREVVVPLGCRLASDESEFTEEAVVRAHSGRFLLGCGSGQAVLDGESGALQSLPLISGGYLWEAVGSRYAAGPASKCAYKRCLTLTELATGRVSGRRESAIPDLDRAGAPRVTICRALRRLVSRELLAPSPRPYAYSGRLFAHPAKRQGYLELDRCKGPPTLIAGRGAPRDFDLRDGLLTWDTGNRPSAEPSEGSAFPSVLGAYDLSTGSRRTWQLPRLSVAGESPGLRSLGYSEHVGRRVFWIATRTLRLGKGGNATEHSSVYSARF